MNLWASGILRDGDSVDKPLSTRTQWTLQVRLGKTLKNKG